MDMSVVDSEEIQTRTAQIAARLDTLFRDVGPKIAEIGRLRDEFTMLTDEAARRGLKLEDPKQDGK